MATKLKNKINMINISRFRKLININIDIADRITIVAGHNGIGKSTILGLIANGSELKGYKSYFEKIYQSQFQEIFHLDLKSDYIAEKESKYSVLIAYNYEQENIFKRCTVSKHGEDRLKVVPRSARDDGTLFNETIAGVGASGKIPIPTIYVGMSRVIPIGESDKQLYTLTSSNKVNEEDIKFLNDAYHKIIGHESIGKEKVFKQKLRHSSKSSIGPDFLDYPYQSVSLGQDSLSTILTALISFKKLKREMNEDYKGGILLIDEIDACLHPSAQIGLFSVLDNAAKELNLQIICTTHSLTIIKETLGRKLETSQNPADDKLYYNVVYLQNTMNPTVMKNVTYKKIKNDMFLRFSTFNDDKQEVKVYFEDNEALYFFNSILNNTNKLNHEGLRLTKISAQISCDTLLKLPGKDSYFKSILILVDGDTKRKGAYKEYFNDNINICSLPGEDSPEKIIHMYLEELVSDSKHIFWRENQESVHSQIVRDNILKDINERLLNANDKKTRDHYKDWFRKYKHKFEETNIIRFWMNDKIDELTDFIFQYNIALDHIRKLHIENDI